MSEREKWPGPRGRERSMSLEQFEVFQKTQAKMKADREAHENAIRREAFRAGQEDMKRRAHNLALQKVSETRSINGWAAHAVAGTATAISYLPILDQEPKG